ncbi:ubiquinone biosynthesis hydroxylase [Notoacmeibacter ruber]|uniref:Ubiquinone biosynthesis hydroxylase n=1 Tax=Notoacmeibacter ruber TaxID=2670375 RepID=A0A3L7JEE9_9HYPH|nr:ubiquinone biosynthesis hydroxylase [Notoacmeibacter ruber]RLQ89056.1 ubiquinone biosynthesis hydroxylase [Notoacmeibacter ruber]
MSGTEGADRHADIVICGAGYVGLATAVAIKQARPSLDIVVADAAPEGVWRKEGRASAIAAAAQAMLEQLGVWQRLAEGAQPINEMIVTDSRNSDPIRPVFLTFSGEVEPGQPFAHMLMNRDMIGALRERADELGIEVNQSTPIAALDRSGPMATVTAADGRRFRARLIVAADGARSRLRDWAGIRTVSWQYGQSGIVCTIGHERPHNGRAEEHFLPVGPFAILPLPGNRSSIVWNERTADAERLVKGDPFLFEAELEARFGRHLGAITVESEPRAFPLGLTLARAFVTQRLALAGDAAHGIHPIAGQGLNLGFKDVAALAEIIVEADRLGQDFGQEDVLEAYQRWRRFDTLRMGATSDILNRLFSNDITPVRMIRDFGLGLVERMPGLKRDFIRQAAGHAGPLPRLLKGQAI